MSDEPTPWEDINPPMASAPRRGQHCESSDQARITFRNELTACLALTAPVGMTEESRGEWLAVAWDTLKDIPPDILALGARAARRKCDHPAKVVPFIIAETKQMMRWHRESKREHAPETPRLMAPGEHLCTAEEAAKIMAEFGLKRNPLEPLEE